MSLSTTTSSASPPAHTTTGMTPDDVALTYKKMSQRDHVLQLPDSYIGSAECAQHTLTVVSAGGNQMEVVAAEYNLGLYKIIDELLVNAWDQVVRTNAHNALVSHKKGKKGKNVAALKVPVTQIDVSIDPVTTELTVRNNGEGIDIAMHPEHQVFTVELIFGHLLTSTNYHKGEKLTGGKNGFGAKLANVFSKKFVIETVDQRTKQKYTQMFTNNMSVTHAPEIVPYDGEPFTQVSVQPDFARFGMSQGWTDAMLRLVQKRAVDLAACAGPSISVTFNSAPITVHTMSGYMQMFAEYKDGGFSQVINDRWEVGVAISDDGFKQQSFVNGVWTIKGGKHVDYIATQVSKYVCEWIEKKKKVKVKAMYVRENLMVFVKALIANPSFDGQTKETLTTPASKFGSKCELPPAFLEKLHTLGLIDRVVDLYQFKEMAKAKKEEGKKRGRISGIPKLDDANKAGGKEAHKCTLILTEGDSAKAMAVAGLSVVGRDYWGVFPLRGKLINTRDKMTSVKGLDQMNANEELVNMKKILGLEQGRVYASEEDIAKHLRYGRVMIMTDQDVDGSHIKGLFMNWIDSQWKSLMQLNFVTAMSTPVIKVKKASKERSFYSTGEYIKWQGTAECKQGGWKAKYYKGLGTSTTKEAKEYFAALNQIRYYADEETQCKSLDLAFAKDRADDRKAWMADYDIGTVLDSSQSDVSYTEFVDKELKHFSIYDTQRSIANLNDGLKPSQRKTLFACFKRNLVKEIKVAQLAGYISEKTGYHHGEQSLNETIIGMAQTFVASNNVNLLVPNGQFGTRLQGGKDAASPRYIYTLLHTLAQRLFHEQDMPILEYLDDDGQQIEPRFYVPILPVVLMNGVQGVGTGYSTSVPMYNPMEICDAFVKRLKKQLKQTPPGGHSHGKALEPVAAPLHVPVEPFPDLQPWYKGFTGQIIRLSPTSYLTKGKYRIVDYKTVEVTELPIGLWTDDYKARLEEMMVDYVPPKRKTTPTLSAKKRRYAEGFLKNMTSHCTESTVHFILEFRPEVLTQWLNTVGKDDHIDTFEKNLKLTTKLSLTNMHLFDEHSQIRKYASVGKIMEAFYDVRLAYYAKRKAHHLGVLQHDLDILQFKVKFIEEVIASHITVAQQTKPELMATLEKRGYPMFIVGDQKAASYNYLVTMPIYSLTTDTLDTLRKRREEKHATLAALEAQSIEAIWLDDLKAFRKDITAVHEAEAKLREKEMKQLHKSIAKQTVKAPKGKGSKAAKPKAAKTEIAA